MGFVEGSLPEARLLGDDVFPKTLLPAADSDGDLANSVMADRESVVAALRRHRALLFRGFKVASADDFERAVEAFGWDNHPLPKGGTTRHRLSERIYTANEASLERLINFHHELTLRDSTPSKIFFFCSEPSPEGGETSIVASDVVVEKMEERMPEVMAKVAEVGFIHVGKTAGNADVGTGAVLNVSWRSFMGTGDAVEARRRALEDKRCREVRFLGDGSAEFIFGPLNPIIEHEGKRAWIIPILGYDKNPNSVGNKFGDGDAFPEEAADTYRDILEENCVDIKWQKGDVLLLENLVVQHARRPGKPPRRVLVSMCK